MTCLDIAARSVVSVDLVTLAVQRIEHLFVRI